MKRLVVTSFLMVLCSTAVFSQAQDGRGTWYVTDSKALNASHATLPLGTRVRVTNLQNDRQVIVTINNRIVETPNRLIDISKAAADNLQMNERGTTPVRIEVLSRRAAPTTAEPVVPATPAAPAAPAEPVVPAAPAAPLANANTAPPQEEAPYTEPAAAAPPPSTPPEEELSVTTTAVSRRPAAVQQEPQPVPQNSANPGIVNQTVITINGIPLNNTPGVASAGVNPPYVSSPEGTAAIADSWPSVVSPAPAVVSPNPAVVSPNPAIVSPSPVVVAPAPAIISPVVVPPVIAQPVLAPPVLASPVLVEPVLANPILSEPVVSNPVVSKPVVSEPVVSNPVVSKPVVSEPVVSTPVRSKPLKAPPVVTASPPPAARPLSVPPPQGEVVPARIVPRKPDPYSQALYRVQVGSFLDEKNAMVAYKRLVEAGFSPSYEHYNNYFRVVLTRIRAGEIENVAWRLGAAQFSEILLREER